MQGAFFRFLTSKLLLLFVILFASNSYATSEEKEPYTNKYEEINEIIGKNSFPVDHTIQTKKFIDNPLISYDNSIKINEEMISEEHDQFIKITNST
ncbi:MAG: hypothetical protein VX335_05265, partial [Pseudomonadota bacterium]|nr:hypothetical protein [Pseudomonadota bacterium]